MGPGHDGLDLRTGGGWRFVSNPGTDKESAVSGDFLEVSPPDHLVQTFADLGPRTASEWHRLARR
jgi:uncharacterized protein YndB with AHSA1/START domain